MATVGKYSLENSKDQVKALETGAGVPRTNTVLSCSNESYVTTTAACALSVIPLRRLKRAKAV